jgi:Secretion system C-terminal sorting domain
MKSYSRKIIPLFVLFSIAFFSQAQTTITYTSPTTWTVPATVTTVSIKVYGGGGGTGGQDCGAGCSNAAAGSVGYVVASYTVTPGDVVGIYPGGKGVNGSNSVTGTGGGTGGADTYAPLNFNGGTGGNAGGSGSSGGGGGGGAASIITINSTIRIVAGGAGGGGGMANMANSGLPGNSTTSSNGTNTGGNGTSASGDGGGGGGGGGGQFASAGGNVHPAGGETAGDGGFRGTNSVTGASIITTNGTIAWTNAGQIEITFLSTLPVTWLSFTATKQSADVILNWSTATEQNTRDYIVQHSINAADWSNIGNLPTLGNSSTITQYSFVDKNPVSGINYYRLLQRDVNGTISYSKVISLDFSGTDKMLKIYPNPVTDGSMTVSLKEAALVEVYNNVGAKVMQKNFPAGKHLFILSQLSKGTYYIKVKEEGIFFVIQ